MDSSNDAVERKRRRLEAWKLKQQQQAAPPPPPPPEPPKKVALTLKPTTQKTNKPNVPKKKKKQPVLVNAFGDDSDEGEDEPSSSSQMAPSLKRKSLLDVEKEQEDKEDETNKQQEEPKRKKRKGRWDSSPKETKPVGKDALDEFMENLKTRVDDVVDDDSQQFISAPPKDDEQEEKARRALVEALKAQPSLEFSNEEFQEGEEMSTQPAQTVAEVRSEKARREQRLLELERQAAEARASAEAAAQPKFGRLYMDSEEGIMEEAERNLDAAKATPDALVVLAELNKKRELKAVDHSKIEYMPFQKNLYRVPRSLANLTNDDVISRRANLKVRVRGHGAPAPVSTFEECGLSERVLQILKSQNIEKPFPVQAQCIPCIMAGRDVIGIAKTGSGKTLAYLLPMLRHILVQPPLAATESGPIGLITVPARELAYQVYTVCRSFAKPLGLRSTAVYGGAGVAEQIADLKRGTHICVATPGRLIDILTMQSGKILSLQRVTYVVLDEADRQYDAGFAPQISAILSAIRPDAQTVLFSATFPKAVETLAKSTLKYPVEVMVGGRSVASDNVVQYAELVEEEDKFLRLLQLLGEYVEGTKKVIVFVDTQVRADSIFEQLLRSGYPCLTLHGGKEQEDRDSTIADFKRRDGPNVLVATGVAGRGLDVTSCVCVINYCAPNHLEAYVHQIGRTGRASNKGVAYTFVNSTDEEKFAPIVVRALSESGCAENISPELKKLSETFKEKVAKGEAKYASSGFKGKGYTYDSSELSEAQKMARMEKRQALIEAGLLDPDEEDPLLADGDTPAKKQDEDKATATQSTLEIPDHLTPEILALPGMKEALLRRAGINPTGGTEGGGESNDPSLGHPIQTSDKHWLQEVDINDYPRDARAKVTQKDLTSRFQDEFRTAVTLKGSYFPPGKSPAEGERRLYLHMEAASETFLRNAVLELHRILNEETLKVGTKGISSSHKYNVL
jgi:ATP-dependent RNA helicase DDX46/PRP5